MADEAEGLPWRKWLVSSVDNDRSADDSVLEFSGAGPATTGVTVGE